MRAVAPSRVLSSLNNLGVSQNCGLLFGSPCNKDCILLGSKLRTICPCSVGVCLIIQPQTGHSAWRSPCLPQPQQGKREQDALKLGQLYNHCVFWARLFPGAVLSIAAAMLARAFCVLAPLLAAERTQPLQQASLATDADNKRQHGVAQRHATGLSRRMSCRGLVFGNAWHSYLRGLSLVRSSTGLGRSLKARLSWKRPGPSPFHNLSILNFCPRENSSTQ